MSLSPAMQGCETPFGMKILPVVFYGLIRRNEKTSGSSGVGDFRGQSDDFSNVSKSKGIK